MYTHTFVEQMLRYCILHYGEPSYVGIVPLYLRMSLKFSDFPTRSGSYLLEKYLMHDDVLFLPQRFPGEGVIPATIRNAGNFSLQLIPSEDVFIPQLPICRML